MGYQYILFDLDGTLTDSGEGITNSVMYALKKYEIEVKDRSELYKFIGPPLVESFEKYYGFSEEESAKAVEYYREYYKSHGIFENRVYDGIEELLAKLKGYGKILVVATAKPELFAIQVLEHFELAKYFTFIAGSNLNETRTKKDEIIRYALESCDITDLSKVVMVGDREHDILAAKMIGIDSIGVLFGYGSKEELESAGANFTANSAEEIGKLIIESP